MFQTPKDEVKALEELGLTTSEAKVYLALAQVGASRVGSISDATGIHRVNLYQILRSLEDKCLIEKEVESPSLYKATDPHTVLPMLVNNKQMQISTLRIKAEEIAGKLEKRRYQSKTQNSTLEKDTFTVIPGSDALINKLKKAIHGAHTSIDSVTNAAQFSQAITEFSEDYKKALGQGVRIRIATERRPTERRETDTLKKLSESGPFEVKYSSAPIDAVVSVFDADHAAIMKFPSARLAQSSALWSNNSSFITVVKGYFEDKWNKSTFDYGSQADQS